MKTKSPETIYRWAKRPVKGLIQLTRYKEYVFFVAVTTMLGAKLGGGELDLRLLIVFLANVLVVGFAFMYNDVEDAPDDALDARKALRNPISAGMISPTMGKLACLAVAVLLMVLYATLGLMTFALGALCLLLACLYSWRVARLKAIPVADLISHSLSLAGLQFLCAYFAYDHGKPYGWLLFLSLVFFSVYGELNNEVRDIEVDQKAGIKHTANLIGLRPTKALMITCVVAGFAVFFAFIALEFIPWWILLGPVIIGPMLMAPQIWKLIRQRRNFLDDRESLHNPMVIAGLLTMVIWFVADKLPIG